MNTARETPTSFDAKAWGAAMQQRRLQLGLSLEDLGVAARRSSTTVRFYEQGRSIPPVPVMIALAECLQISVEELIDGRLYSGERSNALAS